MFASKQTFYVFVIQALAIQLLLAGPSSSQSVEKVKAIDGVISIRVFRK